MNNYHIPFKRVKTIKVSYRKPRPLLPRRFDFDEEEIDMSKASSILEKLNENDANEAVDLSEVSDEIISLFKKLNAPPLQIKKVDTSETGVVAISVSVFLDRGKLNLLMKNKNFLNISPVFGEKKGLLEFRFRR